MPSLYARFMKLWPGVKAINEPTFFGCENDVDFKQCQFCYTWFKLLDDEALNIEILFF